MKLRKIVAKDGKNIRHGALQKLLVKVGWQNSEFTTRQSKFNKREQARRTKIFNDTRPHYGDDLIEALEFEQGLRDDYRRVK